MADVPSPLTSTCDTCLVIAPGNSFLFRVVVRDDMSAPVPFADVALDFRAVPGIVLCSGQDPDGDGRVVVTADASGVADFYVRGGGASSGFVIVNSVAVTLCAAHVRSPDLDGSLVVDGVDQAAHDALPADALAGDYDCDGDKDADDRSLLDDRLNESCVTVQAESRSWGRLKALYR
jgi:hypothetical protein